MLYYNSIFKHDVSNSRLIFLPFSMKSQTVCLPVTLSCSIETAQLRNAVVFIRIKGVHLHGSLGEHLVSEVSIMLTSIDFSP